MKKKWVIFLVLATFFGGMIFPEGGDEAKSNIKINFSERFRFVAWDNAINLDDSGSETFAFTRNRTSLGVQWLPLANLELGVKLTNEFRVYLSPKDREFDVNEIFFDNLYLKWQNVAKLPLTLTFGRQNIMLGEGFVVMDGQPLTGSRSIYFNALRADYTFNSRHKITAFVSYIPEVDDLLPIMNKQDQALEEQAHKGLGFYYTARLKPITLEAYYVHKETEANTVRPLESGINTIGARLNTHLGKNLSFTTEAALQSGHLGNHDRLALGGYFHLDCNLGDRIDIFKTFTLGGIYLGGDNPATDRIESWDPLFSRWPKWSESYIYTLIRETGVAYWSNLSSIYVTLLAEVNTHTHLTLTYYKLLANQYGGPLYPGGTGKERGDLFTARLNLKFNANLDGHFVWENFSPGDYYFKGADGYNWLRFELMVKF